MKRQRSLGTSWATYYSRITIRACCRRRRTRRRLYTRWAWSVKSELNDKPAQGQKDQRDLMIAEIATQAGDKLAMPAWNRTQETAADYLGVDLLVRAGYSQMAMK